MSHITRRKTKIKDPQGKLIKRACKNSAGRMVYRGIGNAKLYGGTVRGHRIELKGWRYPVVIDPISGTVSYDNYNGRWGEVSEVDNLKQAYGVEKVKEKAEEEGHEYEVETTPAGDVKITVGLGGETGVGGGGGGETGGGWGV